MNSKSIVFCGPSGCGKSTILKHFLSKYPYRFGFSISHTTRKMRSGEINGREYHFVSKEQLESMIANREMLEYAQFSGNYYGTSKDAVYKVQASGRICIFDIEVQGVKSLRSQQFLATYIFIKAPSLEELENRLRARGTENEENIQLRLKTAVSEIEYAENSNAFNFIVINRDISDTISQIQRIINEQLTEAGENTLT